MPSFSTAAEARQYDMDMIEYNAICEKLHHKYMLEDLGLRTKVTTRPLPKDYLFVTINPPQSLDLQQFLKTIDKMCSKPWIGSYLYVIEQRNEPDIVEHSTSSGVHTHILIRMNKHMKPSIYTRELKNTFRTKLDVDNFHLFNIKNIDEKEQLKIQGYMLNWKDDQTKHQKQYGDDVYRNINNLQRYYTFSYNIQVELRSTYYEY